MPNKITNLAYFLARDTTFRRTIVRTRNKFVFFAIIVLLAFGENGSRVALAAAPKPSVTKTNATKTIPKKNPTSTATKPSDAKAKTPTASSGAAQATKNQESKPTPAVAGRELNPQQWLLRLPEVAKNKQQWQVLISELMENQMDYGAVLAANRMLVFFEDIESKEFAYKTIIEQADLAWPYSVRYLFIPGDIAPTSADSFARTYNLYKALLNETAGMKQWAKSYFSRIDKEKLPKYRFYVAVQNYKDGDHEKAIQSLRDILSAEKESGQEYFLMKVARTLARIYYEKERYKESLEIYESFLLKLNPINPTDWLEASWNLYRLKRYSRALGYIYNMESAWTGGPLNIEKFVLRAAVYRDNCESERMAQLSLSFNSGYEAVLSGIKDGTPLSQYDALHQLPIPENAAYVETYEKLKNLQSESKKVGQLTPKSQRLAQYLYKTEIEAQEVHLRLYMNDALQRAAERLFTISETLKFLSFDVAREKFNPNAVFETSTAQRAIFSERSLLHPVRQLAWKQFDDYWRDERVSYIVEIKNRCAE